jgi:carbon monoxide dehydrogenase subunit G
MQFNDKIDIAARQEAVWAFLLTPESVGGCAPGVESINVIDDTHFQAIVKVGIGQFRSRFTVDLELADLTPPSTASIRARGSAPGTAVDATARMALTPIDQGTKIEWEALVTVNGKLAAVGSRLIQWTANKLIGQTFDCIKSRLEAAATSGSAETGDPLREG